MPRPLTPGSPEHSLRTIVQTVQSKGKGTVYVGVDTVSHRTRWGRVFLSKPTTHTASIQNFKDLLKKTYPGSGEKIDQILATSVAKGRLTSGAVLRAYKQLHEEHKFRIQYPADAITDEQKLRFEDERALSCLQDPETIKVVCDFTEKLADSIENSPNFTDQQAGEFLSSHLKRAQNYPVHHDARNIKNTKADLVAFLRNTARSNDADKQVLLLSMLWALPKTVAGAEKDEEKRRELNLIDRLYGTKVHEGKQHTDRRAELIAKVGTLSSHAMTVANDLEAAPLSSSKLEAFLANKFDVEVGKLKQPVAVRRPASNAELAAFLRSPNLINDPDRCRLLAAMLKDGDLGNQPPDAIKSLYEDAVEDSFAATLGAVTKPGTFGNTEIPSTLMDRFGPHQKEREAVFVHNAPNKRVQKFLDRGNPYISGSSGMANCGSLIFPLIGVSMMSEEGRRYAEALAAFIVGAGEHSYPEAYKSLNLSMRYLQLAHEPPRTREEIKREQAERQKQLNDLMRLF